MKKLFFLLCFTILALTSCSDDNSSSETTDQTLRLIKIVRTEDGQSFTENFIYNGTTLARNDFSDGSRTEITYTGELITKQERYNSSNIKDLEYTYHYNASGQLDLYLLDDPRENQLLHRKFMYVYNDDGTINYQQYSKGDDGVGEYELDSDGIIYDDKIMKNVPAMHGMPAYTSWTEYTYDTYNNPYMLITGYNKMLYSNAAQTKNYSNNVTSSVYQDSNGVVRPQGTTTYEYNDAHFPTVSTYTNASGDVITTAYYYE